MLLQLQVGGFWVSFSHFIFTNRFIKCHKVVTSEAPFLWTKTNPHFKCVATLPGEMSMSYKQQPKQDDFCNNTF